MFETISKQLLDFIKNSPSCYHVTWNFKQMLLDQGFIQLLEQEPWNLEYGKSYFTIRNGSSLIAFRLPSEEYTHFQIVAAHSDSPSFKIKEKEELAVDGHYIELNTEKYGGMLCAPWFDRPLSVAGRVMVRSGDLFETRLVNIDRDLIMIPNLAIHMNRQVNDGYAYHPQKDMIPLFGDENARGVFKKLVAEAIQADPEDILGTDLFLYNRMPGTIWGANREFISAPKLDDLQCAYAAMTAFLSHAQTAYHCGDSDQFSSSSYNQDFEEKSTSKPGYEPEGISPCSSMSSGVSVCCIFDNEEVGSTTKQGADSTFLSDTLQRLNECLGRTSQQYKMAIAGSFMISADNAHAVHPHHLDKADPINRPYMNHDPVIKYNANQKYTTDSVSGAIFKEICKRAGVPYQVYANHSDIPGGSTLGNISNSHVSLNTVDIGLAQLAMHSPYETAGVRDTWYLVQALKEYYQTSIRQTGDGRFILGQS